MRMEREKRAAEERAERMAAGRTPGGQEEDINAELGVGSVAADAELDAMKEQVGAGAAPLRLRSRWRRQPARALP